MSFKPWRIFPRAVMETILNGHARQSRHVQPLLFHGPRGTGKTTLILERLLEDWNTGPHLAGYVDFAESIKENHPKHGNSYPWASWSTCPPANLHSVTTQLEESLESMVKKGVRLGFITSHKIFEKVNKWHPLSIVLRQFVDEENVDGEGDLSLWDKAVMKLAVRGGLEEGVGKRVVSQEEAGMAALELAKEVIRLHQGKRKNATKELNRTGGFSWSLACSATDWPMLLLELLCAATEISYFQPKLVINNVEVLKLATLSDDTTVCGSMYHDNLIFRIMSLGLNEGILPVFLVTSDSYYSHRSYTEFGIDIPNFFISREFVCIFVPLIGIPRNLYSNDGLREISATYMIPSLLLLALQQMLGWTPTEAKLHMVGDYFTSSEMDVLVKVLGKQPRHFFEFFALKLNNSFQKVVDEEGSTFEDIVDAYLAYLQVTVVNPAMDKALLLLQKFAMDVHSGKISKDKLRFGAPWRHPPWTDKPGLCREWAKIQLMDFMQSFSNTEFGVNYILADPTFEIFDDPSVIAMIEVGLLYVQRHPAVLRPVSIGFERCFVRWIVQEQVKMGHIEKLKYIWQRVIRGRSYRHLMKQIGYK